MYKLWMQFLKIVIEYTLTVHTATFADDVRKNYTERNQNGTPRVRLLLLP